MEIERKWVVSKLPNAQYTQHNISEQLYLSASDPEVRVKFLRNNIDGEYTDNYAIAVKAGIGLAREELETNITSEYYEECKTLLKQKFGRDPIFKEIYVYDNIVIANVDNGKLLYAEVEFNSEEEANAYKFPFEDIMVKEVTNDSRYFMKNYWNNGCCIPEE